MDEQFHNTLLLIDAGRKLGILSILEATFHPTILKYAQAHADYQAKYCRQGHNGWDARRRDLVTELPGYGFEEVCAESWPEQSDADAAGEMFNSWQHSRGHWEYVNSPHDFYAYAMSRGTNGVWFACGIFADAAKANDT